MIEVRIDDRLRLISAMLLFTRQGEHQQLFAPHPIRLRTLDWLAPHSGNPALRMFRRMASRTFISGFYCIGVYLGGAPDFAPPEGELRELKDIEPPYGTDIHDFVATFSDSMADFYNDAQVDQLWKETSDAWALVRSQAEGALAKSGVAEWINGFYGSMDRRMVMVPMPTQPAGMGFGPHNDTVAYSVVGPAVVSRPELNGLWQGLVNGTGQIHAKGMDGISVDDPFDYRYSMDYQMVLHEFAHTAIRQLFDCNPDLVPATESLNARIPYRGYFPGTYPDWQLRLEEMIIRATECMYTKDVASPEAASQRIRHAIDSLGLTPLPAIIDALSRYAEGKHRGDFTCLADYGPELERALREVAAQ